MVVAEREVSLPQTAARLKVDYQTAYKLLLRGELQGGQRQGKWYVEAASLDRYEAPQAGSKDSL